MLEKICIILLVNLVFFAKTLGYKYVSDDIPVSQRPKPKEWWKLRFQQLEGCIRTTPQEDHLLTTVLHALVCVFIYTAFGSSNVSFLAALLFAFNPINNQASVWISGRGYVLSALGMTMAMTFPAIGPLLLLIATYSNAGFLAPICLVGSKFAWFLWFIPLVWGFHFFRFKKNVADKIGQEMFPEDKKIHPVKLIIAIKTFAFYFTHALIPFKNTFYHSYMQSMSGSGMNKSYTLKDRFFWIGLIIVGSIFYYWLAVPWNMVSFGLLWWCVCIAPFCNFVRMQQEVAERYAYLSSIGLMFVLASLILQFPLLIGAFLAMYMTKLWFWMDAYQDDYYLVEASCVNSPDAWFVWHIRGIKRWDQQSYQEAVILWTMAKIISPNEFKVLFNIASALKLARHDKEALMFIELAAKNIPKGQEEAANKHVAQWHAGTVQILI